MYIVDKMIKLLMNKIVIFKEILKYLLIICEMIVVLLVEVLLWKIKFRLVFVIILLNNVVRKILCVKIGIFEVIFIKNG